jgi:hypothetical protein
MRKILTLSTLLTFFLLTLSSAAQTQWEIEVHPLCLTKPIKEFADVDTGNGLYYGFGLGLNARIGQSPLKIGGSFQGILAGSKSMEFSSTSSRKVSVNVIPVYAYARFDLAELYDNKLLPFVGANAGYRFYNTRIATKVTDPSTNSTTSKDSETLSSVSAFSHGIELGLHYRFAKGGMLALKWERSFGRAVEYTDIKSISINDEGVASFDKVDTRTDMDVVSLGFIINLSKVNRVPRQEIEDDRPFWEKTWFKIFKGAINENKD